MAQGLYSTANRGMRFLDFGLSTITFSIEDNVTVTILRVTDIQAVSNLVDQGRFLGTITINNCLSGLRFRVIRELSMNVQMYKLAYFYRFNNGLVQLLYNMASLILFFALITLSEQRNKLIKTLQ